MVLFINDIRVTIFKTDENPASGQYNHIIDAKSEVITPAKLINHVWLQQANEHHLAQLLELLNSKVPLHVLSIFITVENYEAIKAFLRIKFRIVQAAGGLVRKKDKFLMIYRLKKWDLPKGKKEKGEKYKQTAVREIEEECNVSVRLEKKLCTTWHTYTMNKKAMLKKTRWYVMDIIDDSNMKPSVEEDIEEVRWMNPKEVYHSLHNSYKSINYVFEQYYAHESIKIS
jgi:8-oxo-(d)GTP phosphatase